MLLPTLADPMALYPGDCLDLLPFVPDSSIDLICADLPYGATRCPWDSPIDLLYLWPQYLRVAKPNAAIVLLAQTPFDKRLGCSNLPMLRYEWIWEKTNATGHLNAKKMPLKAHENILVFYDKLPTYNPQKTQGHPRKTTKRKGTAEGNGGVYGAEKGSAYDSTERYPRSVLTFAMDKQKSAILPTQKPQSLLSYLIKTYSNLNDIVLDNCMGSGTTGAACKELGRLFLGMEKTLVTFNKAVRRITEGV